MFIYICNYVYINTNNTINKNKHLYYVYVDYNRLNNDVLENFVLHYTASDAH